MPPKRSEDPFITVMAPSAKHGGRTSSVRSRMSSRLSSRSASVQSLEQDEEKEEEEDDDDEEESRLKKAKEKKKLLVKEAASLKQFLNDDLPTLRSTLPLLRDLLDIIERSKNMCVTSIRTVDSQHTHRTPDNTPNSRPSFPLDPPKQLIPNSNDNFPSQGTDLFKRWPWVCWINRLNSSIENYGKTAD